MIQTPSERIADGRQQVAAEHRELAESDDRLVVNAVFGDEKPTRDAIETSDAFLELAGRPPVSSASDHARTLLALQEAIEKANEAQMIKTKVPMEGGEPWSLGDSVLVRQILEDVAFERFISSPAEENPEEQGLDPEEAGPETQEELSTQDQIAASLAGA